MIKNKLIALVTALAVVAAPVSAIAAVSPNTATSSATSTGTSPVEASVSAMKTDSNGWIKVTPGDTASDIASNVPASEYGKIVASFVITAEGVEGPYRFSYSLGSAYAGATVTIYVQYADGTTGVITAVADANGTITFTEDKLPYIHTLTAEPTNGSAASRDTSARSPQTGVNTTAVAGVSAAAVVAAGAVAVTIRKKVNE